MKRHRDSLPTSSPASANDGRPALRPCQTEAGAAPSANIAGPMRMSDQVAVRGSDGAPVAAAILCEKYRKLTRQHLERLQVLFTKFSGLFSHLAWGPIWRHRWSEEVLPAHSSLCRQLVAGRADVSARCRRCASQHLACAARSGEGGHFFTCFLGVQNFWRPIIVRGCIVGLAFVQALSLPAVGCGGGQRPLRAFLRPASGSGGKSCRRPPGGAKQMARPEFRRAAQLFRLVLRHVETSVLADLRESDLNRTRQALLELRTVAARLRQELNGRIPAISEAASALQPENHAERVAHAMLEYVHRHYAQPITLRECAANLGMNAAYLSDLFSHTIGLPFKAYLTELRMQKARELLSISTHNVSEVADAVGYSSENCFRVAFKNVTGLSPRSWRETLQLKPAGPPAGGGVQTVASLAAAC